MPTISTKATPVEVKQAFETLRAFFSQIQRQGGFASVNDIARYAPGSATEAVLELSDPAIPSVVAGFTATGAFNMILLQWDIPTYHNHAYTEIYRASVDDLGQAVYIGSSTSMMYPDTPPNSSLSDTYYYWARNISTSMVEGDFNAVSGTQAKTADEPEYILQLLIDSKWKASTARALDFIGYPSKPNGYAYKVTTAGTSGTTEPTWPTTISQTVSDGSIVWTCSAAISMAPPFEWGLVNGVIATVIKALFIGDATITNAMIQSLAADKITAGTIAAAISIMAPMIYGGQINLGNFAGYAWPASGGTGAHLSASGLLIGNANDGKYFQVQAGGNVYAPGFTIVNGTATFSGDLAAQTVKAGDYFGESITIADIYGLARINGNRLDVKGTGSIYLASLSEVPINHNLGRYVVVMLFNETGGTIATDIRFKSQDINTFIIRNFGEHSATISFSYI